MDERTLVETLRRIAALHAGATTPGERAAAAHAMARVQARLTAAEPVQPPIEYRFSMPDPWDRQLFLALLRRHGLHPFRRWGQRHSSVMVRVSQRFVDDTLWPEYLALSETLRAYLADVTERVIAESIHADTSEAPEEPEVKAIPRRG